MNGTENKIERALSRAPEQTSSRTDSRHNTIRGGLSTNNGGNQEAIVTLNNGKAVGPDGILSEVMKVTQGVLVSMEVFHPLFENIWNVKKDP